MLVGIHQPHYLGWLRYYEKIARCDRFILLDDVEFTRNGWQNRNRIRTAQGPHILTIPVRQKLHQKISEVEVSQADWGRRHWKTVCQSYSKAAHFSDYASSLQQLYDSPPNRLTEVCRAQIEWHLQALSVEVPLTVSSDLNIAESSSLRLVKLVRAVGGTAYLTGRYALGVYLDPKVFQEAGIDLYIFNWKCPEYPQLWPKQPFEGDLATLDLLFNTGPKARAILSAGATVERYE